MNLFILMFKTKFKVIDKENIKVIFSGRREPLSKNVLDAMDSIVKKTENNTKGILNMFKLWWTRRNNRWYKKNNR